LTGIGAALYILHTYISFVSESLANFDNISLVAKLFFCFGFCLPAACAVREDFFSIGFEQAQ